MKEAFDGDTDWFPSVPQYFLPSTGRPLTCRKKSKEPKCQANFMVRKDTRHFSSLGIDSVRLNERWKQPHANNAKTRDETAQGAVDSLNQAPDWYPGMIHNERYFQREMKNFYEEGKVHTNNAWGEGYWGGGNRRETMYAPRQFILGI